MKTNNLLNKHVKRKLMGIAGAFLTLAVPFLLVLIHPHIEGDQSLCPFKMLTGFPCPGCGITKSLMAIYQGDFSQSLHYHIFGLPTFLFCIFVIFLFPVELLTGKVYFRKIIYSRRLAYTLGYILATYHIIRLIHFVSSNTLATILKESIWS